jgi:alpha-glucosidase
MDFTPGDFATWRGSLLTARSQGHHLALTTLFESGIVHIAECPQNLQYFVGRDIMKRLPTTWDESLLLEGLPTSYATVARRKGADWWVSGISVNERTCRVKLDFLEEGTTYTAYIYRDGSCRSDLKLEKKQVAKGRILSIKELSEGGFLVQISPDDNLDVPLDRTTYEAETALLPMYQEIRNNQAADLKAKVGVSVTPIFSESPQATGGYVARFLGQSEQNDLQWQHVYSKKQGKRRMTIAFFAGEEREMDVIVNGQKVKTLKVSGTDWGRRQEVTVDINLRKGNNVIRLANPRGWMPDIDGMTLSNRFIGAI